MFRQPLRVVNALLLWSFLLAFPLATIAAEVVRELDYCPNPGATSINPFRVPRIDSPSPHLYDELVQLRTEEIRTAKADEFARKFGATKGKKVTTALRIFDLGL